MKELVRKAHYRDQKSKHEIARELGIPLGYGEPSVGYRGWKCAPD